MNCTKSSLVAALSAAVTLGSQIFAPSAVANSTGGAGTGIGNTATGANAFVGGGRTNQATGQTATVSGGSLNTASGMGSTVSGGDRNTNNGFMSVIGGGEKNTVTNARATVAGGGVNTARGDNATVGGGFNNVASGPSSTVPGGRDNVAAGLNSFAAGARAKANHDRTFVWSGSTNVDTSSSLRGSFIARAPGGFRFITVAGNPVSGARLLPNATAWTALSDRESKTDFQPIQPREVLSKLAAMPVTSWQYKHDPSRRYIGPTSQDFMAAFHLGQDDRGINTLDADGVTFAAIKGLVEELKERDKAMAVRDQTIEELKAEIRSLRGKVESGLPPAP